MKSRNILIIAAVCSIVLALLITLVYILGINGRNTSRSDSMTGTTTTIGEDQPDEITFGNNPTNKNRDTINTYRKSFSNLPYDTQDSIQILIKKLPVNTDDYELTFSQILQTFFVQRKTTDAEVKLIEFFDKNGLKDFYLSRREYFKFVKLPASSAMKSQEEQVLKVIDLNSGAAHSYD